jgi:CheY-like chemotaxis protein
MAIKVLIVDDSDELREVIAELLRSYDYKVEVARDGREGLELVLAFKPDIVLTDMKMPSMDGPELKRRLTMNPCTSAIPVIFMSGFSSEFQNVGTRVLHKPFTLPQLIKALAQVL